MKTDFHPTPPGEGRLPRRPCRASRRAHHGLCHGRLAL